MRLARAGWLLGLGLLAGVPSAAADMELRGLLDLSVVSSLEGQALNRLAFGDSGFDPYRLRLFLDARVAPGFEVHVQSILHEGQGALRADGAYALWTPWPDRDLSLEAGKIPWPIGTYAPRTYSDRNALMGTPLIYHYRTALRWDAPTVDADQLVAGAGAGQLGFDAEHVYLPVIDERWWDTGAALVGSRRPFEIALGVVQGSPSWPSPGPDNTPGQTVLGRLGFVPAPGVRAGVSGADGTWIPAWHSFLLPTGRSLRQYRETTLMLDAELSRGPLELVGEGVRRRWETITVGTLEVTGGYAQARWTFPNGAWLAVRAEALRFSDVTPTASTARPWDDDVDRWEGVAGYRVTQDVRVKLAAQRTLRRPFAAASIRDDLIAGGLSIRF